MSARDVADLLQRHEIRQEVINQFEVNDIDGKAFILLDDDDLKNLGLKRMGDRVKVRDLIAQCKGDAGAPAQSSQPTGVESVRFLDFECKS